MVEGGPHVVAGGLVLEEEDQLRLAGGGSGQPAGEKGAIEK